MESIEINTAHNIVVTHELAGVFQRIAACSIDLFLLGTYSAIMASIFSGFQALMYILVILVIFFYHLAFEIFNEGQSPGKQLVKLRVVSIQGMTPSLQDYFLRWIFRMVDITFSIGTLGILSIVSSSKNQRIGDLLARTTVISLRSRRPIDLASIQQLQKEQREIRYPGIVRYSDTDMLLVKKTLQRFQKHPNPENTQMVQDLKNAICRDLSVELPGLKATEFLRQVLSDYIILTR